jgi:glycosyltransferase involved in cell wall biosynthesis
MKLLFLDTKPNNPNRYISRVVFSALRRHPDVARAVWVSYADALPVAQSESFDAFVAFDGEEADNVIVRRLCRLIPLSAIWFTEDPYEYYRNIEVSKLFKLTFTNDSSTAGRYPGAAFHLPLAADKTTHFIPVHRYPTNFDVFFAGTAWPNRLEFLHNLQLRDPNLSMKLVLVTNPSLVPHIRHFVPFFTFSPGVSIRDFCRLANSSLLTLTLPRQFSTDPGNAMLTSDTPGPRIFETALAGSCQLVDSSVTPQAHALFTPHQHFLPFQTLEDCLAQVAFAKNNKPAASDIATKSQQHALDNHLYDNRVAEIVSRLKDIRPTKVEVQAQARRVLFVAHNITKYGHFGGAEIYLERIRQHISIFEMWTLVPSRANGAPGSYVLLSPDGVAIEEFTLSVPVRIDDLSHHEFEFHFQSLLSRHAFEIVHFNHFIGYPLSLPHFVHAYGSKVVFSLHDYYSLCVNFNLIGMEDRYCAIPERPPETCDTCLERTKGFAPGSQARRLRFTRHAFEKVDAVLVGSHASADIFHSMFPHVRERTTVLPPPIDFSSAVAGSRGNAANVDARILNVAMIGNFTAEKGSQTAVRLFRQTKGLPIVFHVFGRLDESSRVDIETLNSSHVQIHGPYSPGQFPPTLSICTVALFLSPWPETYCMTLTEAQLLSIVPVVTALGAQAERVTHGRDGFHVPIDDSDAVLNILQQMLHDPEIVPRLRSALGIPYHLTGDAFTVRLEEIYNRLVGASSTPLATSDATRTLSLEELGVSLWSDKWVSAPTSFADAAKEVGFSAAQMTGFLATRSRFLVYLVLLLMSENRSRFLASTVGRRYKRLADTWSTAIARSSRLVRIWLGMR